MVNVRLLPCSANLKYPVAVRFKQSCLSGELMTKFVKKFALNNENKYL
jgi:hypothetical protein